MTPETLAATKAEVNAVANTVGSLVGVIDPKLIPLVILGKAIAAASPDLINDVEQLIASKSDPVQADNDALAVKIHALFNPSAL